MRGYEFEHQHAFYPGLAMATRATTRAVGRAARLAGRGRRGTTRGSACAAGAAAAAINAYAFAAERGGDVRAVDAVAEG